MRPERASAFVEAILGRRWTGFAARLLLVDAYVLGGIVKASEWPAAVAEQARFAITPAAFGALPPGPERFMATKAFFEHLGLVGGVILAAMLARAEQNRA